MSRHYAKTPAPAKPGPAAARPAAARGAETTRVTPGNPLLRGAGDALLQLQRRYGNRYTQQVISHAREPTSQKVAPVSPEAAPVVQASLVLGPASDRYEQEADRVAEVAAGHAVGHAASHGPTTQPQAGDAVDMPVTQALQRARGSGLPLPATLRWSMEQALGADFGGVRVHTGARSDQLNRSLQAAAFTSGQDIFFRRGAYSPASPRGRALLAHELTHVVQQRNLRRNTVQRYFAPPLNPFQQVMKPTNSLGLTQKAPHPSRTVGWAISKDVVQAQELLVTGGARLGHRVTRFTALLTPGHVNLGAGVPTRQGTDPLGWAWVERNEVRSANRQALRYWIRFHLLNDKLGGKGTRERHLVPTTKTANAQWDHNIERPMTAALQGYGATPVYYDVKLTYWSRADAPATYVDATTGTDYSPNITLFPRSIEGNWRRFERGQWVAKTPVTVNVDKPRGISGEEAELTTHQNLKQLGKLFHIDEDILSLLQKKGGTAPMASYGDVRNILEAWAMHGDTLKKVSDRRQAIYASEGYLRTALAGGQSFKLKINNQLVPDDATPEAWMFGPPVEVQSHLDLVDYKSLTSAITTAYMMAQKTLRVAVEFFPPFEEFVWLLATKGDLYGVRLADVQRQWDNFKAANESLPPMSGMQLVPDQDEIRSVLQRKTAAPVVRWVRDEFTRQVTGLTRMHGASAVADVLANAVAANYGDLLRRGFPTLTVEHANDVPKLARALLAEDPVRPLAVELNARLAAGPDMLSLNIAGSMSSNPFNAPLTVSMAAEMAQRVAAEQQRRQAAMPPPMAPPQPIQAPPTGRHRIPAGTSGSPPRRTQPGNPPILKAGAKTHPYNKSVIRALRVAVPLDRRWPADQEAQEKILGRLKQVEARWKSTTRVKGKATVSEDVNRALKFVYPGHH